MIVTIQIGGPNGSLVQGVVCETRLQNDAKEMGPGSISAVQVGSQEYVGRLVTSFRASSA